MSFLILWDSICKRGVRHMLWQCLSSLGTGVFKRTVGSLSEGFSFLLLLSLRNLLYTFFYTTVFSCPPSTKSSLRQFQYLALPSESQFLSKSQPSTLTCCVPQTIHYTRFCFHNKLDLCDTPRYQTITSSSNTPVPLSNEGLRYSANDLVTLNDLFVTDLSCINTTSIQELHQALAQ
jgi:hypothetical protein